MSVAVLTDTTSCLSAAWAAQEGVAVIPLHVMVGGRGRLSGREIEPEEVAEVLSAGKERVSTSRPSPGEFVAAYRALAERSGADQILSVHLSGKVSGTVEAAGLARDELAGELGIKVVDSQAIGLALGYAVCTGARALTGGASVGSAARAVRERAAASRTWFYVDTLEHLRRGGRIGRAQALAGSALAIKPLLRLRDGEVQLEEKVRRRGKALARLLDHATGAVQEARAGGLAVDVAVHELAAREAARELADELGERTGQPAEVVGLDPVVAVHTGPGTLGVVVSPRIG